MGEIDRKNYNNKKCRHLQMDRNKVEREDRGCGNVKQQAAQDTQHPKNKIQTLSSERESIGLREQVHIQNGLHLPFKYGNLQ